MSILSLKIPTAFLELLMWLACITSVGIAVAEEPMNYVLTTDNTPLCTPDELAEWQDTVYNYQGEAGRDPVGYNVGSIPAKTQT